MKKILLIIFALSVSLQAQQTQIKKYINEGSWQLLSGYFAIDSVYQNFCSELRTNFHSHNSTKKSIPYWCVSESGTQINLAKLGSLVSSISVSFTYLSVNGKNIITSYRLQKLGSNNTNSRLESNAPEVSTLVGYYHLACKRFDDIKYYEDYREFYNIARNTPYLPAVNFQQIDFDPLKFEFNYCKKILGFNVCGTKTAVLRPGPVLSDKDDPRNTNANNYPSHYFTQISDMTAYAEQTNTTFYNPTDKSYQLTAVISDEATKQVVFFRDGNEPVYYGNKVGEYDFVQPIAVKELNGFVYVLDKITHSERKVIVLKPTYNTVPNTNQGGYTINYIGNFGASEIGLEDYQIERSNDIGGYKKLNGSCFLVMTGFSTLQHFEVNTTTGFPVQNTVKRFKYIYNSITEKNGFTTLQDNILRLDCTNETTTSPGYTLMIFKSGATISCANTEYNKTNDHLNFAYYNANIDLSPNNLAFMNIESVWICTDNNGKLIRFSEEGRFLGGFGNNSKSEYSTDLYNPNAITPNPITDFNNPFRYRFMVASEWGFDTGLKMFSPVVAIPEIQVFEKADNGEIKVTFPTSGKWNAVEKALGIGLLNVKINNLQLPQNVWESQITPTDFNNLPAGQGNPLEGYPNEFNMSNTYLSRGWNTIEITIRIPRIGELPLDVKQKARFYWLPTNYSPNSVTGNLIAMSLSPYANEETYIYKPITVGGVGAMVANNSVYFNEFGNLFFDTNSSLSIQSNTSNLFSAFQFSPSNKLTLNEGAFICASTINPATLNEKIGSTFKNVFLDENIRIGINTVLGISNNCNSACVFRNGFKDPSVNLSYQLIPDIISKTIAGIVNIEPSYYNGLRFELTKYESLLSSNTMIGSNVLKEFSTTINGVQTITSYPNFVLDPCSKYKLSVTNGCNGYIGNQKLQWFENSASSIDILTAPTLTIEAQIDICERVRTQTLAGFNPQPSIGFAVSSTPGFAFWKLTSVTSGLTLNPQGVLRFNNGVSRSQPYEASYTYNDLLGCSINKKTSITIWTVPVRSVVTTNSPICEYDYLNIHVLNATTSGLVYKIQSPYTDDITFIAEMGNIIQYPNSSMAYSGVYTTTSSNHGCTSNPRLTTVRINSLPGLNIGTDVELCLKTPRYVLTAQPTSGTFSGVGVVKVGNRYFFVASVAGFGVHAITYNFTSPTTKCSNAISKNITVGPIITLGVSEKICVGESPFFPSVVSPLGGVWSKGAVALTQNLFTPSGVNVGSHLLTYNFTSPSGCVNSATKIITIVGLPASPAASNNSPVCENSQVILSATSILGATYLWSNLTNYNSTIQNSTIFGITTTQAGAYLVRAFKDGCFSQTTPSAITLITVHSLPNITISSTNGICFNGLPFDVSTIVSPLGGVWSGLGINGNNFLPSTTFIGVNKIDYSYTDANGCQSIKSTNITVFPAPVVEILTNSPSTICATNFMVANLIANPTGNSYPGPFAFQWTKNGININTATGQSLSAFETGIYTISVSGLCGTAAKDFGLNITSGFEWLGANTNWNDTKNWCGGSVPTAIDVAQINIAPNYPIITIPVDIKSLIVSSEAKIDNTNTLIIREQIVNNGTFNSTGKIDFVGNGIKTISGSGIIKTKDADVDGILTMLSNLSVTGSLLLKSNTTLVTNDKLILHSDKLGTGRIDIIPANSTVVGQVSVQRWIPAKRSTRYFSSPVLNANLTQWQQNIIVTGPGNIANGFDVGSNLPTVLTYDETLNGGINFGLFGLPNINSELLSGKGYQVAVRGDRNNSGLATFTSIPTTETKMTLKGNINQGNITLPVTYTNTNQPTVDGWNFVGNPYPSQIDWDEQTGWTKNNIDNAIYLFDPRTENSILTTTPGVQITYINGISSPNRENANIIASSQGFYIKANAANPVLQINENAKSNAPHTSFFRKETNTNFFRINVNAQTRTDEAVIGFSALATTQFDAQLDAQKLQVMQDDSLVLASLSNDFKNLCINIIPNLDSNTTVIPISIQSKFAGLHTLNFKELAQLESNIKLYLYDNLRNTTKPINANTEAKFYNHKDSSQNGIINRFVIIATLNNNSLRKENNDNLLDSKQESLLIFPNPVGKNKTIYVKLLQNKEENVQISILNIAGNLISKTKYITSHNTITVSLENLPSGIYFIEIKSKSINKIQKIVVE